MRPQLKRRGRNRWYVDLDRPLPNGDHARIPGVTTIVKEGKPSPGLINWGADATAEYAVNHWDRLAAMPVADRLKEIKRGRFETRDKAGDVGRTIHRIAQDLMAGKTVPIPEGLEGYVNACVRFLDQFDLEEEHVEMLVWSATHYYCGQLDLIGSIVVPDAPEWDYIPRDDQGRARGLLDWKSSASGIWGDLAYQLAPYRFADFALTEDGEVIEVPEVDFCAGIHLRTDGTYSVVPVEAGRPQFEDFLVIQKMAGIMGRYRELAMDPITPPYENRYRLAPVGPEDDPYAEPASPPPVAVATASKPVEVPAPADPQACPCGRTDVHEHVAGEYDEGFKLS